MKKLLIILSIAFLCSCSNQPKAQDINELLMSIKNYECEMDIALYSNKNSINCMAHQIYKYPEEYSINFLDNGEFSISYSSKLLTLTNNFLNLSETYNNYENINTNPLFLSYFLNSYFNSSTENILESNLKKVSIILPSNNAYLSSATLELKNNIPYSITYFDKNNQAKINIIYNKFIFDSP